MATAEERIQSWINPWSDSTQPLLSGTRLAQGRTQLCLTMHPEILTPFLVINTPHIQRNAHFRVVITEVQNLLAGLKEKHFSSEVSFTLGKST